MLPKIKKKVKAFLMDETGTISKSNIIKGALFLTAAGTAVKKVKAGTYGGEPIDGSPSNVLEGEESNKGSGGGEAGYSCSVSGFLTTCTAVSGMTKTPCPKNNDRTPPHTSSGSMSHWNADEQYHSNHTDLDFDWGNDGLEGTHSHHGYHADGDYAGSECDGYTAHTSHCSHSAHGSHNSW